MQYLVTFHLLWLIAALLIGFATGWISVVNRGAGLPVRWLPFVVLLVAIWMGLSLSAVVPGRFGYWLDLGLWLFAVWVAGCLLGTWLRALLIARQRPPGV